MELNTFDPYLNLAADLKIFDPASLRETEALAACMSIDETLDFFGLSKEQLAQSKPDEEIFTSAWKRGRARAKYEAATHLFAHMKGRGGAQVALAYLRQVAAEWPTAAIEAGSNKNFSFKVIMDGDEVA